MSVRIGLCLYRYLCLLCLISFGFSVSLCIYLCISISILVCRCVFLYFYLYLSIYLSISVCFSVSVYVYFSMSRSRCLLLLVLLSPLSFCSFFFFRLPLLPPPSPCSSPAFFGFLLLSFSSLPPLSSFFFSSSFPVLLFSPLSPFLLFLLLLVLRLFLFSVFSSSITGFSLSFSSHFLASSFAPLFSCSSLSLGFLSLSVFRFPSACFSVLGLFALVFRIFLLLSFLSLSLLVSLLFWSVIHFSFLPDSPFLSPLPFLFVYGLFFFFFSPFCIPPRFGCRLLTVRFLRCTLLPPPSPSPSSACSLFGLSLSFFSSGLPWLPFFVCFLFLASSVPLVLSLSLVSFLCRWQRFTGLPFSLGFAFVCSILFVCSGVFFCAAEGVGPPIFFFL